MGIVQEGGIAGYSVRVDGKENFDLKYRWSISYGTIVSGQGTEKIEVRQPNESVTATVEIDGLPAGCPNTASETSPREWLPQAVKLAEFRAFSDRVDVGRIDMIVARVIDSPGAQLYVFMAHKDCARAESEENELRYALGSKGIDVDRIKVVRDCNGDGPIQFWLVLPGATPPTYKEASGNSELGQDCPAVSLRGPSSDQTLAGEEIVFVANVSGGEKSGIAYKWAVSAGTIVAGMDTSAIHVYTGGLDGRDVMATVEVLGPAGCRKVVSIRHHIAYRSADPVFFDEFEKISRVDEHLRFDNLGLKLAQDSDYKAYIIKTYKKSVRPKVVSSDRRRILTYLKTRWKIDEKRIVFVHSSNGNKQSTKIFLAPI
jgi:hypothetical protein